MQKRKQLRLKKYNYSQNGIYFVTICMQGKQYLFGQIENNEMILNLAGNIIDGLWRQLENKFNIKLYEYIIMPNHIHGIIEINNDVGMPLVGVRGVNTNKMAPTRGATTIS